MDKAPLDETIVLTLRRMPGSSADAIAEILGLREPVPAVR
jgi:hypothetical protein